MDIPKPGSWIKKYPETQHLKPRPLTIDQPDDREEESNNHIPDENGEVQ